MLHAGQNPLKMFFLGVFLFSVGVREEKTQTLGVFLSVCVKKAYLWYQGHLTSMHFHICTHQKP